MRTNGVHSLAEFMSAPPPWRGARVNPCRRCHPGADLHPRVVYTAFGIVGADAGPNWTDRPDRPSLTGEQWGG